MAVLSTQTARTQNHCNNKLTYENVVIIVLYYLMSIL